MKPITTVVIPTYNYAGVVGRAIESVMAQTANNLECFIVDDGSSDNTEEVVTAAIKGDKRFTYIKQSNAGVANARNKGVFSGAGKYVCCLDADDQLDPHFLEACIAYLEEHPEIGIAYTGLFYKTADGKEGLSKWPEDHDYDAQLKGKNQIPTCNVARREMWERLGGQRQRYAPDGAGEEDAEMWLRAGAYGFRAKKVTDAGLFIYSWQSGRVSGDRHHRMSDYLAWHPWATDEQPPFASVAAPAKHSHPVRQYDQPIVSVIIPVGPGHDKLVETALDSLEAQSFRKWECVLAWDNDADTSYIERTYPYARIIKTGRKGAGAARNAGVKVAKAPLVVFLDADDWLMPDCLHRMILAFRIDARIIYTDYIGKAVIEPGLAIQYRSDDRLLDYDEKTGLAAIRGRAKEYDCEMAQNQPDANLYIWNLVTSLVPKVWHDEIGGFDEGMKSWEDWDYYIRLAKAGKCFHRVAEPLVVYRYYSGTRRETGLQDHKDLLQYMLDKYRRSAVVGCNCGKNKQPLGQDAGVKQQYPQVPQAMAQANLGERGMDIMSDDNYVLCIYNHGNIGGHRVIGPAVINGQRIDYGYRAGGDEFLVHVLDIQAAPGLFTPKLQQQPTEDIIAAVTPEVVPTPAPAPAPLASLELRDITTDAIALKLEAAKLRTLKDVATAGPSIIRDATGLPVHKARKLRQDARERLGAAVL